MLHVPPFVRWRANFGDVSRIINVNDIALPPGYRIEAVARGLTFPTGATFDDRGELFIVESGYCYAIKSFNSPENALWHYRLAGVGVSRSIYAGMTTSMLRNILFGFIFTTAGFLHAQSGAHSAVKPVPRFDRGWQDRAKLLDQRVKDNPDTQLLFIGDSITQGWEGEGAKGVWAKYFEKRKAVNLGIGGDRTQHVLWRLEKAPLDEVKPKAAVVMIGTNNSNGEDNTPGQIIDGIEAIIQKLRARLPNTKILLLGIFPRGENFNAQRGKLAQINQILTKFHDGRNVHYLDIGPQFLTKDGILPGDIMPDYLHLSEKGYQIWADAIEPKLSELLGEKK